MDPARRPTRWWLLLLPLAYLLHLAEEWWGGVGFAVWTEQALGREVSTTRFLVLNGIVWPLVAALTLAAIRRPAFGWFVAAFSTLVVVNAALHLLGSVATASYSPGLVTGLLLYLPVGGLALRSAHTSLPPERFASAAALGILAHAAVAVIAFW
jgi:hypothetical protein